jgi:hypothetical protein
MGACTRSDSEAALAASFDHLVGAGEQRGRYREPESVRGLQIDHQIEPRGLYNGKVCRRCSFEYPAGIEARLAIGFLDVAAIEDQSPCLDKLPEVINGRYSVARRQLDDLLRPAVGWRDGTASRRSHFPAAAGFTPVLEASAMRIII